MSQAMHQTGSNSQNHLAFLDVLRGVAIIAVVGLHCLGIAFGKGQLPWNGLWRNLNAPSGFWLLFPLSYGQIGVAIFFVISGFCIHLSYQRSSDQTWTTFLRRRFFRIYPPYLLYLLIFLLTPFIARIDITSSQGIKQLWTHVLMVHNYDLSTSTSINPVFWTIAVEVQLYLLYPVVLWIARRWGWRSLLLVSGLSEFGLRAADAIYLWRDANAALPWQLTFVSESPFQFWFSWCIGAKTCEDFIRSRSFAGPNVAQAILCAVGVVFVYFFKPLEVFTFPLGSLATCYVVRELLWRKKQLSDRKSFSILTQLGIISYSMYLIHVPILWRVLRLARKFFDLTMPPRLLLLSFCTFPVIYFASWLSYRYIELPSIGIGRHRAKLASSQPPQLADASGLGR